MTRLPLDYNGILSAWEAMAGALYHPDSPYMAVVSHEIWKNKLSLIRNIIEDSPDMPGCRGCGQCCLDFPFACRVVEFLHLIPYMALNWLPDRQIIFFEKKLGLLTPGGKNLCPFLEEGKCSVYSARPLLCRRSVCGDHICNQLSKDFDSMGHWCNDPSVSRRLTLMNILYYDYDKSPPEEMGWEMKKGGDGPVTRLVVAPFEMWLLLLFNNGSWRRILDTPGYTPLLKFA